MRPSRLSASRFAPQEEEVAALIDALSQRYMGQDYGTAIQSERVILKIAPDRQLVR